MSSNSSFLCPITQEIMRQPVTDRDGNTYEKSAIVQWLTQHGTSPITRNPMTADDLVPNRALLDAIEGASNGEPTPALVATAPPAERVMSESTDGDTVVSVECLVDPETAEVVISICPLQMPLNKRLPVDVCCVIDISGSMGDAATVKDEQGKSETHGLNLLDIVKHATRTVAGLLGPLDRLSLTTFTNDAAIVMPLTFMDAAGKQKLDTLADAVTPQGMTNLWAGLHMGMEQLRERPAAELARNATVLLLTDGQPNVEPPRGHIPSLVRYLDQFEGGAPFSVSTFGFGYNLDTALLNDIADKTGGMYVFIPDSGLVGTVFVNTIANVLCTVANGLTVSIDSGRPLVAADPALTVTSTGGSGSFGTLHYGQSRQITFRLGDADTKFAAEPPLVRVAYKYCGKQFVKLVSARVASSSSELAEVRVHVARRIFADFILNSLKEHSQTSRMVTVDDLKSCHTALLRCAPAHPLVQALVKDLDGQVALAFKDSNFTKWGRHFLPSIVRATLMQQCNNFKDFSVQLYGGKLFKELQDAGEAVFTKIPSPKPSQSAAQPAASASGKNLAKKGGSSLAPVSMTKYYNCRGGCVLGHCLVALSDNSLVQASSVRPGDVLASGAVIRLVVRIAVPDSTMAMVIFPGGLAITEFHPVRVGGEWVFPVDVEGTSKVSCTTDFVYTFVLDGGHSVIVNDVEVVTLAHGLTDNSVVAHEYLGTDLVLRDLSLLPHFDSGCVTVGGFVRDPVTLRIQGLLRTSNQLVEQETTSALCC